MISSNTFVVHYGQFNPEWTRIPGLIQCGPFVNHNHLAIDFGPGFSSFESMIGFKPDQLRSVFANTLTVQNLVHKIQIRKFRPEGVLLHYIDPFLLQGPMPLTGLSHWNGPRILVIGDLHHGINPIKMIKQYLQSEFHDSVVLAFNPSLIRDVQSELPVPVHTSPPGFFRYPFLSPNNKLNKALVHVGSLDQNHPERKIIVKTLLKRQNIPFYHTTTRNHNESALIYNKTAITLNIPLNNDLNHRFFEIISARGRQIVFADPKHLLGPLHYLRNIPGVYWARTIEEIETLTLRIISDLSSNKDLALLTDNHIKLLLEPSLQKLLIKWSTPANAY